MNQIYLEGYNAGKAQKHYYCTTGENVETCNPYIGGTTKAKIWIEGKLDAIYGCSSKENMELI